MMDDGHKEGFSVQTNTNLQASQSEWRARVAQNKETRLYRDYLKQLGFHDLILESQSLTANLKSVLPLNDKTKLYSRLALEELNSRLKISQGITEGISTSGDR